MIAHESWWRDLGIYTTYTLIGQLNKRNLNASKTDYSLP